MRPGSGLQHYVALATRAGFQEARIIPARSVVTAEWVRLKCQFGCSGYNQRPCCPPYTPTPALMKRVVAEYRHALIGSYITDRYRRRLRVNMQRRLAGLERAIFLDGCYQALALGAGPCRLCRECSPEEPCQHPDLMRPSMESCGIDVYATCRNAGIRLSVVTHPDARSKHINLILID